MKGLLENPMKRVVVMIEFHGSEMIDGNMVLRHCKVLKQFTGGLTSVKLDQTPMEKLIQSIEEGGSLNDVD